jgi:hypothetical protein
MWSDKLPGIQDTLGIDRFLNAGMEIPELRGGGLIPPAFLG